MYEWITILYALIMEATTITWPAKELGDRIPFLKRKNVWVLLLAIPMFILSISYLVYSFVWTFSGVPFIRVCGCLIMAMSLMSLSQMVSERPKNVLLRRVDGAVCFVCLTLIAYARTKGW